MDNQWSDPAGYIDPPQPVRYRIRDAKTGEVVERGTHPERDALYARHFHALHPDDQPFAEELTALIQQACTYFFLPDDPTERLPAYTPLEGVPDVVITDAEVIARIARMDQGENTREAARSGKGRYPLTDLPFDQQRALVEQIEATKRKWQFEILGEMPVEEAKPKEPDLPWGFGV